MLDTNRSGSKPIRHDAETFRVAKELIMLSSRAASTCSSEEKPNDSPSNISGFFDHMEKVEKRVLKVKVKARANRSHRTATSLDKQVLRNIINSRCDLSQSDLLKEHRVRFRRVRRRWNIEQRTKKEEYLARFQRQQQAQDKTALEIAANDALFGQTGGGADEPWTLGLPSGGNSSAPWGAADANWFGNNPSQTEFIPRGGNLNPSRKIGGNSLLKAKGGNESLPLASVDAPSMGNYDRDAHLRMQLPHRITVATQDEERTIYQYEQQLVQYNSVFPPSFGPKQQQQFYQLIAV
eukprot:jgi/Phyca11/534908/estExt2_fgenesh1_pg.C_PHYCAscaffold_290077